MSDSTVLSEEQLKQVVYTPSEVSSYGLERIKKVQTSQDRIIHLDIPEVKDYFAPLQAGQLCAVIAQTSNYKSAFLHMWSRQVARQLAHDGRDEIIVHVSVEESIEEQSFLYLAHESGETIRRLSLGQIQDWDRVMRAAVRVGTIPIYRLGDSMARDLSSKNLYMTNMIRAIDYLANGSLLGRKVQPAVIYFDYLQAFPIDPEVRSFSGEHQRRLQVRNDIYALRDAARHFDCPVIVAVQAKQKLDHALSDMMQIPGNYDGEESSAIGQRADRIISLWMPKMSYRVGQEIEHKDFKFRVTEDLLLIRIGKQRGGFPSGRVWKMKIDFATGQVIPDNANDEVVSTVYRG